jgi:hypothetical protein
MIKLNKSTHRIPFFDSVKLEMASVDKLKEDYQEVMCVCAPTGPCAPDGNRPV